jgi:hypothetical protein
MANPIHDLVCTTVAGLRASCKERKDGASGESPVPFLYEEVTIVRFLAKPSSGITDLAHHGVEAMTRFLT